MWWGRMKSSSLAGTTANRDSRKVAAQRTRVLHLARTLAPLLAQDLAPDTAGSKAIVLASLVVDTEEQFAATMDASTNRRALRVRTERALRDLPVLVREMPASSSREVVARFMTRVHFPETEWAAYAQGSGAIDQHAVERQVTIERLQQLQRSGVDISLLKEQLRLSPAERIEAMLRLRTFTKDLARAGCRSE